MAVVKLGVKKERTRDKESGMNTGLSKTNIILVSFQIRVVLKRTVELP